MQLIEQRYYKKEGLIEFLFLDSINSLFSKLYNIKDNSLKHLEYRSYKEIEQVDRINQLQCQITQY